MCGGVFFCDSESGRNDEGSKRVGGMGNGKKGGWGTDLGGDHDAGVALGEDADRPHGGVRPHREVCEVGRSLTPLAGGGGVRRKERRARGRRRMRGMGW